MTPRIDFTGKRFWMRTVIKFAGMKSKGQQNVSIWLTRCDCGTVAEASIESLRRSQSCGCLQRRAAKETKTKHGFSSRGAERRTYRIWKAMHSRCRGSSEKNIKDYVKRGIEVCDRWSDFRNFLADMGEAPDWASIDRIDNDKGYFPENCRWADGHMQARNTRRNTMVTFNGTQMTVAELSKVTGVEARKLSWRIAHGWALERAVQTA